MNSEKRNLVHSPAELKMAYRLVTEDLYNSLVKMKDGQTLRWNKLGKFTKKAVQSRIGLPELKGQKCIYYRINFSPFVNFKKVLNQNLKYVR